MTHLVDGLIQSSQKHFFEKPFFLRWRFWKEFADVAHAAQWHHVSSPTWSVSALNGAAKKKRVDYFPWCVPGLHQDGVFVVVVFFDMSELMSQVNMQTQGNKLTLTDSDGQTAPASLAAKISFKKKATTLL